MNVIDAPDLVDVQTVDDRVAQEVALARGQGLGRVVEGALELVPVQGLEIRKLGVLRIDAELAVVGRSRLLVGAGDLLSGATDCDDAQPSGESPRAGVSGQSRGSVGTRLEQLGPQFSTELVGGDIQVRKSTDHLLDAGAKGRVEVRDRSRLPGQTLERQHELTPMQPFAQHEPIGVAALLAEPRDESPLVGLEPRPCPTSLRPLVVQHRRNRGITVRDSQLVEETIRKRRHEEPTRVAISWRTFDLHARISGRW